MGTDNIDELLHKPSPLSQGSDQPTGQPLSSAHFRAHAKRDPWMLHHKAVYVFLCVAGATVSPFLPLYLVSIGFSPETLALLLAARPLVTLVAAPLLGALADRVSFAKRPVLLTSAGGGAAVRYSVSAAPPGALVPAASSLLASDAIASPLFALLDAATLAHLDATSSTAGYGPVRAWGPLGIAVFGVAVGPLLSLLGLRGMFALNLVLMGPVLLLLALLPLPRAARRGEAGGGDATRTAPAEVTGAGGGGSDTNRDSTSNPLAAPITTTTTRSSVRVLSSTLADSWQRLHDSDPLGAPRHSGSPEDESVPAAETGRAAHQSNAPPEPAAISAHPAGPSPQPPLLSPAVLLFGLLMLTMGALNAVIGAYQFLYLSSLGAPPRLLGLALSLSCAAEVPAFLASSRLLRLLGVPGMLLAALIAYALRMAWYGWALARVSPWATLAVEPLHGATFAMAWAAAAKYAHSLTPPGHEGTAQSLLGAVQGSAGTLVGCLLGGVVYARLGGGPLFLGCGAIAAAAAVVMGASLWRGRRAQSSPLSGERSPLADDEQLPLTPSVIATGTTSSGTAAHSRRLSLLEALSRGGPGGIARTLSGVTDAVLADEQGLGPGVGGSGGGGGGGAAPGGARHCAAEAAGGQPQHRLSGVVVVGLVADSEEVIAGGGRSGAATTSSRGARSQRPDSTGGQDLAMPWVRAWRPGSAAAPPLPRTHSHVQLAESHWGTPFGGDARAARLAQGGGVTVVTASLPDPSVRPSLTTSGLDLAALERREGYEPLGSGASAGDVSQASAATGSDRRVRRRSIGHASSLDHS